MAGTEDTSKLAKNEGIKESSNFLRGTIVEGLGRQITGALAEDDTQLTKFHGFYQQDDRDLRPERAKRKLEPAYSFMLRLRIPGGLVAPAQWLQLDDIARTYANGTLRLTTRQTFQYHGVIKSNLKRTMQAIDKAALDTIAACGDVNRNVMATSNPFLSPAHRAAHDLAAELSTHLLPKTGAWREIWLDGEPHLGGEPEMEPIYGRTYLPRKFKAVVAVPPTNDVDIFAHDLGFIAVTDKRGRLQGWNVTVGGGMGMTHGELETFPRTADVMGFCAAADAIRVAEAVVTVQRDWGNRADRKQARLKYTIERRGLQAFRAEVEMRSGVGLKAPRETVFTGTGDRLGWQEDAEGFWHYGVFIENGRLKDTAERPMLTGLRTLAASHQGWFQLTPNQNLIVARVPADRKAEVESHLRAHGLLNEASGLRLASMACVALPTCGLALAEAERYLPSLVAKLEETVEQAGLRDDAITIRMTGCPNGCARPYLAEIGLVGRAPGRYNLYLGASRDGRRLNKLYRRDVGEAQLLAELSPLLRDYARERVEDEPFGDFLVRRGVIRATESGAAFHQDLPGEVDRYAA